jgi:hypothetical protein
MKWVGRSRKHITEIDVAEAVRESKLRLHHQRVSGRVNQLVYLPLSPMNLHSI